MVRCWYFRNRASRDSHVAGGVLDLGRDHGVGVQLRVDRPGGVLTEQRRDDPWVSTWWTPFGATPGHRPVRLEPAQRGVDRGVVGGEHLGADPRDPG